MSQIPKPSHPIVDGKPIDRYWYDALQRLADATAAEARVAGNAPALAAEIEALARLLGSPDGTVAGIPNGFLPDTTQILAGTGISISGVLKGGVVEVSADANKNFADVMSRISLRF